MNLTNMFKVLFLLAYCTLSFSKTLDIQIEAGGVWQHRNDLQIPPNSQGTRFALDQYDKNPTPYYRSEIFLRLSQKHGLRAVYAPFKLTVRNTPSNSVNFNGQTFNPSEEITYTYQFNSYRLTYFYAFWGQDDEQLNIGFTGKIRDADTILSQGPITSNYDNVGFVPLIYFELQKKISADWLFHTSFDGLAGGPGRAFDVSIKLRRKLGKLGLLGIGTRILEGGADNAKVYSFSFFQYALVEMIFYAF